MSGWAAWCIHGQLSSVGAWRGSECTKGLANIRKVWAIKHAVMLHL
jgi:hypothetical protein